MYKQKAQSRSSRREEMIIKLAAQTASRNMLRQQGIAEAEQAAQNALVAEQLKQEQLRKDQKLNQARLERERRLERRMLGKSGAYEDAEEGG